MHHHSVRALDKGHDFELFRKFSKLITPPAGLEDVERDIVAACNGVPLALKIAGAGVNPVKCKSNQTSWQVPILLSCFCQRLLLTVQFPRRACVPA
jgi:hypothetical protein